MSKSESSTGIGPLPAAVGNDVGGLVATVVGTGCVGALVATVGALGGLPVVGALVGACVVRLGGC